MQLSPKTKTRITMTRDELETQSGSRLPHADSKRLRPWCVHRCVGPQAGAVPRLTRGG